MKCCISHTSLGNASRSAAATATNLELIHKHANPKMPGMIQQASSHLRSCLTASGGYLTYLAAGTKADQGSQSSHLKNSSGSVVGLRFANAARMDTHSWPKTCSKLRRSPLSYGHGLMSAFSKVSIVVLFLFQWQGGKCEASESPVGVGDGPGLGEVQRRQGKKAAPEQPPCYCAC